MSLHLPTGAANRATTEPPRPWDDRQKSAWWRRYRKGALAIHEFPSCERTQPTLEDALTMRRQIHEQALERCRQEGRPAGSHEGAIVSAVLDLGADSVHVGDYAEDDKDALFSQFRRDCSDMRYKLPSQITPKEVDFFLCLLYTSDAADDL